MTDTHFAWLCQMQYVVITSGYNNGSTRATLCPQKCPIPFGICIHMVVHGSLGSSTLHPKWHPDQSSHFCRAECHNQQTLRWTDHATTVAVGFICVVLVAPLGCEDWTSPLSKRCWACIPQNAHSDRGCEPHWMHGSLGPCESAQNGILISSAVFAEFTSVINTDTHGQTLHL